MEEILYNIVYLITNLFNLYVTYRFMNVFFDGCLVHRKISIITYIFRYFLTSVLYLMAPYPIINVISAFGTGFIVTLAYESKLSKKILTTIFLYMTLAASEFSVAIIIGLSRFSFFEKSHNGNAFALIMVEILAWIMTLLIGKFKNVNSNMPIPTTLVIFTIAIMLAMGFLELLLFQYESPNSIISVVALLCVLFTNFIVIYLYDSLSKAFDEKTQSEILKREKNYYLNQSELLQNNHEEIEKYRHDFNNYLLVLEQMIEREEIDKAKNYLSGIADKLNKTEMYSATGNIVIDSIINYKLSNASKKGIDVSVNILLPSSIGIKEEDIVAILGNLLDNAIEAVNKLKENKYITLNIQYNMGIIYITVKNSFIGEIKILNGLIQTSKRDKKAHGIGIKSIESAIANYSGVMDIKHDSGEFVIEVMLYV